MSALLTLDAWAVTQYGDKAPCPTTLRRWARDGRISPKPIKHGRSFFVRPDAVYVPAWTPDRLVDRMTHGSAKTKKRA